MTDKSTAFGIHINILNIHQEKRTMFHLFRKTYIEVDSFVDPNVNRIVISETHGYPVLEMLSKIYLGTPIAFGLTYDDVVGEGKRFNTFLEMIQFCFNQNESTGKKIIIYCDPAAYIKVISLWYKSIFVNIDAVSAYRITRANFSKEIMITHRAIQGLENQYNNFLPDLATFQTVFDAVSVDDLNIDAFINGLGDNRSIEYLLAAYVYDGSHKDELKFRIWSMINRHVEEYLKEAWRSIQLNILKENWQSLLGTSTYTIDNITEVLDDPILEPLKRTNAWRAVSGGSNIARTPLDLSTFTEEELIHIKHLAHKTYLHTLPTDPVHPGFERKHVYIDMIKSPGLTDEELAQVIDYEINPPDDLRFYSMKDEESINVYFVDWILEMKRNNNVAMLQPYVLK
jgi:hypothetical protein